MSVEYSSLPVAFGAYERTDVTTRGAQTTSADLSSFIVNARYYRYTGGAPINFFLDQEVTKSGSTWTYSPTKYWPTEGEIDFFAYSPTDIKGTLESLTYNHGQYPDWLLRYKVKDPVITTINELSGATIPQSTIAKAIDAQNQQDLLLAISPQHQCAGMSVDSRVTMSFKHALAGLAFKLDADYTLPTGATHVILSIAPMCTGGTIALNSSSEPVETRWTLDESEATFYQAYELYNTGSGYVLRDPVVGSAPEAFFLPPQTLKNFTVTARFYRANGDDTYTHLATRSSNRNNITLTQGQTTTINITN